MKRLFGVALALVGVGLTYVPVLAYTAPSVTGTCSASPSAGTVYYGSDKVITVNWNGTGVTQGPADSGWVQAPHRPKPISTSRPLVNLVSQFPATFGGTSYQATYYIYRQYVGWIDPVTVTVMPCPV
jgi:hypothetical protein